MKVCVKLEFEGLKSSVYEPNIRKFISWIVTIITDIYQQMHTVDIKSRIIHVHKMSYKFQQQIAILEQKLT